MEEQNKMEALKRRPNLTIRKTMILSDGKTEISEIGMTVRQQNAILNNKRLSKNERGLHGIAAKILVDGKPIVVDDLMDGFTTEELEEISDFLFPEANAEDEEDEEKNE